MKLYVESNFLVEIIESQFEANACRQLMSFCENGSLPFSIPQFCLFEVVEKIHRLNSDSGEFYKKLNQHHYCPVEDSHKYSCFGNSSLKSGSTRSENNDWMGVLSKRETLKICKIV